MERAQGQTQQGVGNVVALEHGSVWQQLVNALREGLQLRDLDAAVMINDDSRQTWSV
jgi:hypothetical protein